MRISLLIISLFILQSSLADVYKSVDADGNVIFTDKPSPDAEKIKVKEIQTIKSEKPEPSEAALAEEDLEEEGEEEPAPGYTRVAITSPANDTSLTSNDGSVTINATVEPALDKEAGDHLALYMDNKLVSAGPGTQFNLTNLDRGTHSFSVAVIDKEGKEILRSATISFTVLRHSVQHPKPGGATPPP